MKLRTLTVLALVVCGLAAFIYFVERDLPGSDRRRELQQRVVGVEADEIVGLEVEWGGSTVRLERDPLPDEEESAAFPPPRDWRLTEPFRGVADRQLADQLAGDLEALSIDRRLAGTARADVGLEPPRGRLVWRTPERQGELEIGGDVPASAKIVVASSAHAEPLVVAASLVGSLDRPAGDWRSKEVITAARDELERIRIAAAGGEEVVLSRRGEEFAVVRPFADDADPDRVDPLLSDLTGLRAERFLDGPLPPEVERGLFAGPGRIEIDRRDGDPLTVEIGVEVEPEGPRWLRVGGQALEARTRLSDAVTRPAAEWRSRRWAGVDNWRIERLRVEDGDGLLELARQAGDWLRGSEKISYTEVGDLLYTITSARAERIVTGEEAAALPAGSPTRTIVIADGDGVEETLTLHGPFADGVAARVSGRDVVLVLPVAKLVELDEKLAAVRAAVPVADEAADGEEPEAPADEVETLP